jgi:hypothetical protein
LGMLPTASFVSLPSFTRPVLSSCNRIWGRGSRNRGGCGASAGLVVGKGALVVQAM